MRKSIKTGLSFGLTSGIITTLGMIVGLNSGTHSQMAVISGILTIAIADSMSDSLGIHISEESKGDTKHKEIWTSTLFTFLSKLVFATSFLIPVFLFNLDTAIIISLAWGILLLMSASYYIAKKNNANPWKAMGEHFLIAVLVVIATHYAGVGISSITNG